MYGIMEEIRSQKTGFRSQELRVRGVFVIGKLLVMVGSIFEFDVVKQLPRHLRLRLSRPQRLLR